MNSKRLIILGSSRSNGDTSKIVSRMGDLSDFDVIDLNDYDFLYYDYEHKNQNDDFITLAKKILEYDILVFATPVYWYSMSGIMKVFFDRLTDLVSIRKELGRKLKDKKMAVITSSGGDNLNESFWLPFSSSAKYLDMKYVAGLHTYPDSTKDIELIDFIKKLK